MKVMNIVGNRPQFIKLAPVSRELRKRNIEEVIIHTGQHYDENMSDIFFEELGIPQPERNLNIGSGTHAQITAKAMIELECVMEEFAPDCVIVYGDTNSTLAAALTAAKLFLPIIHIEAGPRTYNRNNPEEMNRVVVDHLSDYLCAPDQRSYRNLIREGIGEERVFFTGDVMYDEFLYCAAQENKLEFMEGLPERFILMTWHRQENTSDSVRMGKILDFVEKAGETVILPLHPRTQKMLVHYGLMERFQNIPNLKAVAPVGYQEMIYLMNRCSILLTDSGGASKEASFAGKKCLYMLDLLVWPELVEAKVIYTMDIEQENAVKKGRDIIREEVQGRKKHNTRVNFFGEGNAAEKIVDIIEKRIEPRKKQIGYLERRGR